MALTSIQDFRDQVLANKVFRSDFAYNGPSGVTGLPTYQSPWYLWDTLLQTAGGPKQGGDPAAGSGTPGAGGTAYTNADGGIWFPDTTGNKYLLECSLWGTDQSDAFVRIVDRLVAVGGINITTTGVKDVGSIALPRYTSGVGVEVWCEVSTAGTTTAPQLNLNSYTNSDGTTGHSGGTITFHSAAATRGSLQGPLQLQSGDRGVKSVESINVTVAGGGSATINIVLTYTVAWCHFGSLAGPVSNRAPNERVTPFPFFHPRRIFDGATLNILRGGPSSNSRVEGEISVVEAP